MSTVIVGAGQAGAHAAIALREAGYGGRILLIGEEAERPYERPPLSKQMLTAAEAPPPAYFHREAHYTERDITLLLGTRISEIRPDAGKVITADGRSIGYEHLLLTTGGRARRLQVPGAEHVLYLRTLADARRLRKLLQPGARVVCIGAGVIGLEIASSARAHGCAVTVIEAGPSVMGRSLPSCLAAWLADLHRRHGVELKLGAGVATVAADHVLCTDGHHFAAEIVVAGIGMERNTDLAEAAALSLHAGIALDASGRTSVPRIFAAGDVAAFWVPRLQRRLRLETWRHAQEHGACVGRNIAGAGVPYDDIPWFWTDQHGVNLQIAGTTDSSAETALRGGLDGASFSVWLLDAQRRVNFVAGINAPRDVRAGQMLMRAGQAVDPARIADLSVSAQSLSRGA